MIRLTVGDQVHLVNDAKMLNVEAISLKRAAKLSVPQLWQGVAAFDAECLTALVWLARRRNGEPDLQLRDVEFDLGGLDLAELDDAGRVVTRDPKTGVVTHRDGEPEEPEEPEDGDAPAAEKRPAAAEALPGMTSVTDMLEQEREAAQPDAPGPEESDVQFVHRVYADRPDLQLGVLESMRYGNKLTEDEFETALAGPPPDPGEPAPPGYGNGW